VVHLTITRSCTRRHNWRRPRTRSHIRLVVDSSTPSVQRGCGRRDPPDTPTHTSPSVCLELTIWQSFAKLRRIWGSNFAGAGKHQVSMNMEEKGAFYRRGWAAPRGCVCQPQRRKTPPLHGGNPLFMVVIPSST
jgi:hypothetical protein